MRQESDRQWTLKFEALKKEMQVQTSEQLAAKQDSLQEANRLQMDELLKPIKEQFEAFKRSVEENKTQNEVNQERASGYIRNNNETLSTTSGKRHQEHQGAD